MKPWSHSTMCGLCFVEPTFSEDWARTPTRKGQPSNLHTSWSCPAGLLSSAPVLLPPVVSEPASPVTAPADPSSPCQVKLSSSHGLWNKRYLGRFQNDEITNDFITNAVMSASSLTSFGEVNDLSQITNPSGFSPDRCLCGGPCSFTAFSGRGASKTKGNLEAGALDCF